MKSKNEYLDLTTYNDIYQELVYQRNEVINWFEEQSLNTRNRFVKEDDHNELDRHKMAISFRPFFRNAIVEILNRLYAHDAIEAVYDFNSAELGTWSNTETNMLERELQRLQLIIGKLETRYDLQYRLIFEYRSEECTLYLNSIKVFSCGQSTLRNRLLVALFSDPKTLWENEDVENYFIKHFGYSVEQLTDKNIEKAGKDIIKDVSAKTAVKDFLVVSNSSIRINRSYIT